MFIMKGAKTSALVHATRVDSVTQSQIQSIVNHPAIQGLVAIMPDCHAGAGCVIGFTGRFGNAVIPNIVGVDIGCGVLAAPLDGITKKDIKFEKFDEYLRMNIPMGFGSQPNTKAYSHFTMRRPGGAWGERMDRTSDDLFRFLQSVNVKNPVHPRSQLGTLGGGNHFIEIDEDLDGKLWVVVHTGSRNLGLKVALHFQGKAKRVCQEMNISVPSGQEYLPLSAGGQEYLDRALECQFYASFNRRMIMDRIFEFFHKEFDFTGLRKPLDEEFIESVHNYIDSDKIIRKGAIRAYQNERVLIPLNMADGLVIGRGKGNKDFNFSAPHGAGRAHARNVMKGKLAEGKLTMDQYEKAMKGVFSTSVRTSTIDESPFAYKAFKDIEEELIKTIDIEMTLKPIFNLKAS